MKKQLGLFYGGKSVEHEISIRSAVNVAKVINKEKFNVFLIGISKRGQWFLTTDITDQISGGKPVTISMSTDRPVLESEGELIKLDIAFPLLHGTDGEDGSIQGFFKVLNIPVVGSDVLGSAIAMDKIVSKQLWQAEGIPIAEFRAIKRKELLETDFETLAEEFGVPFMLKAGNLGSSVGITKVKDSDRFKIAVEESLRYSNEVLVERYVSGRELECAILGNESVSSTYPGEILLDKSYEFYNYEAKYENPNAIKIQIPAELSDETCQLIRTTCERAFQVSKCNDYGRVDLFLTSENKVIINEINTIPGFTDVSMFPMLWKQMGIEYEELIDKIIGLCLERWSQNQGLSTSFKN